MYIEKLLRLSNIATEVDKHQESEVAGKKLLVSDPNRQLVILYIFIRCPFERYDSSRCYNAMNSLEIPGVAPATALSEAHVAIIRVQLCCRAYSGDQSRQTLLQRPAARFDPDMMRVFLRFLESRG
ncbi:MAG: hypothetical protein HY676_04750 [Chloroflexi bacterium]|nr:hypothetical protein [Chloroflexota bacterium]